MGCSNTILDDSSVASLETRSTDNSPRPEIKKIKPLLLSLSNYSAIEESTGFPRWAKSPRTVACHSTSILNRLFSKKHFMCSESLLLKYCSVIISGLESEDLALKEHLVYFVYKICSKGFSECKSRFVDLGIFNTIVPMIAGGNFHLSICASRTCGLLYAFDLNARHKFYCASGINFMINQIRFIKIKHFEVHKRLSPLVTLLVDDNGTPIRKYIKKVRELFDPFFLEDLKIKQTIGRDLETFNAFLNLLLDFDNENGR